MSDTLTTARRVLELAEIMRPKKGGSTIEEAFAAYDEWERIMASGWPEEAARLAIAQTPTCATLRVTKA